MASCLRGAFPPVDLRAVCFVRAILKNHDLTEKKLYSVMPFHAPKIMYPLAGFALIGGKESDFIG